MAEVSDLYAITGAVVALLAAATAWRQRRRRSFYATEVYAITDRTHQRFIVTSLAFALAFALLAWRWEAAATPVLAVYAVLAILYFSSFVRGASGEDE